MEENGIAVSAGEYRGFTGYICWGDNDQFGHTEAYVENADFDLLESWPVELRDVLIDGAVGLYINKSIRWLSGTWLDGVWRNGIWNNGTWRRGTWNWGVWKNGNWMDGWWRVGVWYDGTWNGGKWECGHWKKGYQAFGDGTLRHTYDSPFINSLFKIMDKICE